MAAKKVPADATKKRMHKKFIDCEKIKLLKPSRQKGIAKAKSSKDISEAKDMVAEIVKYIGEVDSWAKGDANKKIHRLFDKWEKLCSETKHIKSRKFVAECWKIRDECCSFHDELISKVMSFTSKTKIKIKKISDKAGNNEIINHYLRGTLNIWNNAELPHFHFLYDRAAELENKILDMIKSAMSP